MVDPWILELIGYVASALVAISLMMSSILRLRVINLAGAAAFAVYGVLIEAWPVAVVNVFIVGINIYYLRGILGSKEYFRLLDVRPESHYLRDFLSFYKKEIDTFQPGFSYAPSPELLTVFVLRDMVPAGVLIGRQDGDTLEVLLDFVIPQYRDFKIGRYLFGQVDFFRQHRIREVVAPTGTREHKQYLERMGFSDSESEDHYHLQIER
ncbi:hypothetical protein BH23BAC4_BH23BAC4_00100 [soil metagenome]